jgi:hypothetical protein
VLKIKLFSYTRVSSKMNRMSSVYSMKSNDQRILFISDLSLSEEQYANMALETAQVQHQSTTDD